MVSTSVRINENFCLLGIILDLNEHFYYIVKRVEKTLKNFCQTCREAGTESHGPAYGGQPGCNCLDRVAKEKGGPVFFCAS